MKRRSLGNSGLAVAPLTFGSNVFGWTVNETTAFKLLDTFVNAGFNFIDTADIYSTWVTGNHGGESETIIGRWLKKTGNRDRVIIATKVGLDMGTHGKGLSKAYILRAIEDSLKRLQTDYIDLYQSHFDDQNTPLEETLATYDHLQKQGKIRAIGASNYTAPRLLLALQISKEYNYPSYQCLQPLYNLYDRAEYEKNLEPVCEKYGLAVINYCSLASGFLTAKYRSEKDLLKTARGPWIKKYLNDRGMKILAALDNIAMQYNSTPTKIALAWLLARHSITAPIASATSIEQLNDLMAATQLELDLSAIEYLNRASAYNTILQQVSEPVA